MTRGEGGGAKDRYFAPLEPGGVCARCGAKLRAVRDAEGMAEPRRRTVCSPCEDYIRRVLRPCGLCGATFYPAAREASLCAACQRHYDEGKRRCGKCGVEFLPYACLACEEEALHDDMCHACHWQEEHAERAAMNERECSVCGCSFLPRRCVRPECRKRLHDICAMCHEEYECGL